MSLNKSKFFTGVVLTSTAGSATVTVARESAATLTGALFPMQGIVVSSVFSSFLGFRKNTLPQPGTRVLCLENDTDTCYVLGYIPDHSIEAQCIPGRGMLGAKNAMGDIANRVGHENDTTFIYSDNQLADVVDGEHVVANQFGVLIGLYQLMATLKASELAQVQCLLLDDMVRIISHNFQHHTALGEYNVWHDGKRLMAEFGATHKTAESYGKPAVGGDYTDPAFTKTSTHTVDDLKDFYAINADERSKAIERFKLFLGSVGDFVHMFLVRPHPTKTRVLDGEDTSADSPDTGLADVHVGTDGGVHLRSVKEVFIEKTNWIRVPIRKAAPEDPKGDDAQLLDYDEKELFEFNNNFKYADNPFHYALQIRDYVSYINEKLGYQNFKKHEKDFFINDDIDKEENINDKVDIDQETKLDRSAYALRTAGIYLMPNGGITIRDAWNSAIVMEGGNIYLQPAKDLVSQPLRNNIVKAGGIVNIAAKKDIDLSSTDEGIRLKSEKALYGFSNSSGIVLEANGESNTPGVGPDSSEAVEYIGGIVLKSKLSVYNYAEEDIVHYAKGRLMLQSLTNTDILADNDLTLYGKKNILSFADLSNFSVSGSYTAVMSQGGVLVAGNGSTVLGQKEQQLGVMYDKESTFIDILYGVLDVPTLTAQFDEVKSRKQQVLSQTVFGEEATFDQLKFRFLSSGKYSNLNENEDALPMTMAQQDSLTTELYSLKAWEEKEINDSLPYPGKDLFDKFFCSSKEIVGMEKKNKDKELHSTAEASQKPAEITLESLSVYKVQE